MLIFELFLIIGSVVLIWVDCEILIRKWADKGIFSVRIPQNTVLAIMRDKKLLLMLFAPTGKLDYWRDFCLKKNKEAGREKFVIVDKPGGLVAIGWPWKNSVYEWYKTKTDKDRIVNALHSVDLAEFILIWPSADPAAKVNDPNGIPNYESGDRIEIRSSLIYTGAVRDPEKFLFNIGNPPHDALKDTIRPIWLETIGGMTFYKYAQQVESEKKIAEELKPEIIQLCNRNLRIALGILTKKGEEWADPAAEEYKKTIIAKIEESWGIWSKDIRVGDIEEVNKAIRDAMAGQVVERAGAIATVERAQGQARSREILADVGLYERKKEGEGIAAIISSRIEAYAGGDKSVLAKERASERVLTDRYYELLKGMSAEGRQLFYQIPNLPQRDQNIMYDFLEKAKKNPALAEIIPEFITKFFEKGGK
ncbi:MAG: hypothetical protein Athens101410_375 [Parcubacteria group bacterium Athens1014_10]|nr:MAG: hypothetical protein Athens101410_375 [Parcubacteria group bacterium Athens1014_10]TSD05125.1 MAG: hypothetical protein Athens071412_494 [Parcubacteria group bacterium Athens0714_12]